MDDGWLSNLLFLGGLASLAMPGCSSTAGAEDAGTPRPVGNPLEDDNALTNGRPDEPGGLPGPVGSGEDSDDPCPGFAERQVECGAGGSYYGYDRDYDYYRAQCEDSIGYAAAIYGTLCAEAAVDLFACIARQDCESFACSREQAAVGGLCGLGEPETTGTGG